MVMGSEDDAVKQRDRDEQRDARLWPNLNVDIVQCAAGDEGAMKTLLARTHRV